tara:strand:- start:143 stop:547 length:405 start_codon:yes stop_codon:yes gene_type:complete
MIFLEKIIISSPLLISLFLSSVSLSQSQTFSKNEYQDLVYSNIHMGIFYEIYLEDQQRVKGNGRKYKFRTRVEYPTWTYRGIKYIGYESRISEWRVADCFKSTIDGKIVRALPRSGSERGESELIRAICGKGTM